jgi:NAD-dependent SIR2 family protein deacetylase
MRHHGVVTQLAETRTPGSFGILADLVASGDAAILSGAGLSTESGIPDYRGPTGLARRATPMTYQAFTGSATARRRYWARSHLGWRHIARAVPNHGHHAVAELDRRGLLAGIITQNVDGLHQAAGASGVTELHGSLHRVICLSCGQRTSRTDLDRRLAAANPGWDKERYAKPTREGRPLGPARAIGAGERPATTTGSLHNANFYMKHKEPAALINPDGDAVLAEDATDSFCVVDCAWCHGVLKPDVVFFGENVPPRRVEACYALVERARSLIVLGSSLTVMSGLRYVRHAAMRQLPVVIVNQGTTRGDEYATATIDAPLGQVLTALVAAIGGGG